MKNLALTILGGMGLLLATLIMNTMFSIPPTRAEFDALKADNARHLQNIDGSLEAIKAGQTVILNHILGRVPHEKQIIKNAN